MSSDILIQSRIPARDRMRDDPRAFDRDVGRDPGHRRLLREVLRTIGRFAAGARSILELGAGTGLLSERYVPRFRGAEVIITEPDAPYLREIQKKFGRRWHITYVQACAERFRWPEMFDLIIGTDMYHHIPDAAKSRFFKNLARLLAPTGRAVFGDCFIPAYNPRSRRDRIQALRDFWSPAIEAKRRRGDRAGVDALAGSLRREEELRGEYRTSTEVFETRARRAGLRILHRSELVPSVAAYGGDAIYVLGLGPRTPS